MKEPVYERKVVKLEELYLDPNNPRITPLDKVRDTTVQDIKNKPVQEQTLRLMEDEASAGIRYYYDLLAKEGLISSFPLRVAKLPGGGYTLCDGNTRIVAARKLLSDFALGTIKLPAAIVEALRNVHVEDVGAYGGVDWLRIQGKIHLHGARTWGASKRAGWVLRVLRKQMSKEERESILQAKRGHVKHYVDAIAGYFSMRSFFETRIHEGHFNIMKEVFKNPANRRYLGWNAKQNVFTNRAHVAQFADLIAPTDKSRPRINANNAKMLRTMGEDPALWSMALGGKKKDIRYLQLSADREKGLNDMMLKLATRLEKITLAEVNNFDDVVATRLVSLCNRVKTDRKRLGKTLVTA